MTELKITIDGGKVDIDFKGSVTEMAVSILEVMERDEVMAIMILAAADEYKENHLNHENG